MSKTILLGALALAAPLLGEHKILSLAGSTREDSYNKKLAREAAAIARDLGGTVTYVDLRDLPMPFYDADLEKQGMPANAKKFRDLLLAHDTIVIATPEYNGSIPAVLKNAIDWATRTDAGGGSREAIQGKQFILLSATPGKGGGTRALLHLQQIIEFEGGLVAEQMSLPKAMEAFDANGRLTASAKAELTQKIEKMAVR